MQLNKILILISVSIVLNNYTLYANEGNTVVKANVIGGCDLSCTPINFGNIIYIGSESAIIKVMTNGATSSSSSSHRTSGGFRGECFAECCRGVYAGNVFPGQAIDLISSPLIKEGSSTSLISSIKGQHIYSGDWVVGTLTIPENAEPGTYTGTYTVNFDY